MGLPEAPARWARFLHLARHHRVLPLTAGNLLRLDRELSDEVAGSLRQARIRTATHSLRRLADLRRVHEALVDAGVDHLYLKGFHVAAAAYDDLTARQVADLDVLVRPDEVRGTVEALGGLGYRMVESEAVERVGLERVARRYPQWTLHAEGAAQVDLHWRLEWSRRMVRVPAEEIRARATRTRLQGFSVPTPSLDDLLVLLIRHGSAHLWVRLRWLVDVAELLERHPDREWRPAPALVDGREYRAEAELARGLLERLWPGTPCEGLPGAGPGSPSPFEVIPEILRGMSRTGARPGDLGGSSTDPTKLVELDVGEGWRRVRVLGRLHGSRLETLRAVVDAVAPGIEDWKALPLPRPLRFLHRLTAPLRVALHALRTRFRARRLS